MNNSWESFLISDKKNIKDALKIINKETVRMAFVVNSKGQLVGSVTDGDIRRGLLRGLSVSENVSLIMNTSPKFTNENISKSTALDLMEREHINCIPVLKNKKIISVFIKNECHENRVENAVFLMAGGFGKRLRPLTFDCPKPMLKVGDTPILQIIIERFIKAGFHRFYISTHYMSEIFENYFGDGAKWGIDITYIEEDKPLGTAGALGLLNKDHVKKPIIVMNGDILTGVDFRELLGFHSKRNGTATMCVSEYEYEIPYGVVNSMEMHVESIVEKPKHKVNINSGIYVLDPEIIKKVKRNTVLDMPTLLRKELACGNSVNTFPIFEYWIDIGRREDYEQAQVKNKSQVIPMVR